MGYTQNIMLFCNGMQCCLLLSCVFPDWKNFSRNTIPILTLHLLPLRSIEHIDVFLMKSQSDDTDFLFVLARLVHYSSIFVGTEALDIFPTAFNDISTLERHVYMQEFLGLLLLTWIDFNPSMDK